MNHGTGGAPAAPDGRIKVIHLYKDFDIYNGTIETFLLMAEKLDRSRFDFRVCVLDYQPGPIAERFRALGGHLDSLGISPGENVVSSIRKTYRYLKRERPHILQTYILKPNLYGIIGGKLAGVPAMITTEVTLRNQAPTRLKRIRDLFLQPINSFLNGHIDLVICASDAIRRQWQTRATEGKMEVIYPPFRSAGQHLDSSERESRWEKKDGSWVVGVVGRLSEEKRHVDLFTAFARAVAVFPKARLVVVGDGYLMAELKSLARELGIHDKVEFTGFQTDVYRFLRTMDVLVLPSRSEGLGMSMFEAMSMSLPVIATSVGGIPEVVDDGVTGILVPPFDPEVLAKALIGLLSDPEKMRRMGKSGRKRVETLFNPDSFIEKHESIYMDLVTGRVCQVEPACSSPRFPLSKEPS